MRCDDALHRLCLVEERVRVKETGINVIAGEVEVAHHEGCLVPGTRDLVRSRSMYCSRKTIAEVVGEMQCSKKCVESVKY